MAELFPVTLREMIAEVEREIAMRTSVYQHQVTARKMSRGVADRRIAIMEAVLAKLKEADGER